MSDPIYSPTQGSSHPLPPRPISNNSSVAATPSGSIPQSATPIQTAPRTRGGFEVDDEGENEGINDDSQDDDVYDPSMPLEFNGSAPVVDQALLDRTSHSPQQENGMTPVPVQADTTLANIASSAPLNINQKSAAATPVQPLIPNQASPSESLSALPKSRLANDVVGILEDRIKDDPRGDIAAWLELIEELKSRNKETEVRAKYEEYLKVFPLAVSGHYS